MKRGVIGIIAFIILLSGCAGINAKRAVVPEVKPIVREDLDNLQIELIAQMEAFIEEVRQDNKNMKASIRKVVSDCICPTEMK